MRASRAMQVRQDQWRQRHPAHRAAVASMPLLDPTRLGALQAPRQHDRWRQSRCRSSKGVRRGHGADAANATHRRRAPSPWSAQPALETMPHGTKRRRRHSSPMSLPLQPHRMLATHHGLLCPPTASRLQRKSQDRWSRHSSAWRTQPQQPGHGSDGMQLTKAIGGWKWGLIATAIAADLRAL